MDDTVYDLATCLMNVYESKYELLLPLVLDIVNHKYKNVNIIEHLLDELLDLPTDKGEELFFFLCDYSSTISEESAKFYAREYRNMYKDDLDTKLKV